MQATAPNFWDRIAKKYAAKPIPNPDAYEATLAHVRSYLTRADHVLELGCGTGTTAIKLAPSVESYFATDYAPLMVDIGQEKAWEAGLSHLTFAVATPTSDVLKGRVFDTVTSFNLFHLVPDLDAALQAAFRATKPGGYFLSKTPCLGGMGIKTAAIRMMVGAMRLIGFAPEVKFFSGGELVRRMRQAGFEIEEIASYPAGSMNRFIVARRPDYSHDLTD